MILVDDAAAHIDPRSQLEDRQSVRIIAIPRFASGRKKLPTPRLQHVSFGHCGHSQTFHGAGKVLAHFK